MDTFGTLTISGTGEMYDYPSYYGADQAQNPWKDYLNEIKQLNIDEGVTSVGSYCFLYLDSLEDISFPSTLLSIHCAAFRDLKMLKSINLPRSVERIEQWNFDSCPAVESISVNGYWGAYYDYNNCLIRKKDMELIVGCKNSIIPNGDVTAIDTCAFYGCTDLTSIQIPSSVKKIEAAAFNGCTNLESITFDEGPTFIGSTAFYGCKKLKSIVLPKTLTTIDYGAFQSCSNLSNIEIPTSVTRIGGDYSWGVFSGTPWYDEYIKDETHIHDSIVYINNVAYDYIGNSKSDCSFKENTTCLSSGAFYRINTIVIPESVTYIASCALVGKKEITCMASIPPVCGKYALYFDKSELNEATLYVPETSIDLYKSAEQWKEFGQILAIQDPIQLSDDNCVIAANTYPAGKITYTRQTGTDEYATFCLPFDIDISKMSNYIEQAYTIAQWCVHSTDGGMLKLLINKKDDAEIITAGTPFIAKMKTDSIIFVNCNEVTYEEAIAEPSPNSLTVYDNDGGSVLTQNTELTVKVGGTYTKRTSLDNSKYRAFTTSGTFGPCTWLKPFRCYIYKDDSKSSVKIQSILIDFNDDNTTLIEEINLGATKQKETLYNLNGQRISQSNNYKGIYITNGKKLFRK